MNINYKTRKVCFFEKHNMKHIDYRDVVVLKRFTDQHGRILPRKYTGVSAKNQRRLANAIKRSRFMSLMGYNEN